MWGPQAETCKSYLQKGRQILVEGRIKLDTWKENDGQMRSKHSIVADRVVFMPGGAQSSGAELSSMEGLSDEGMQKSASSIASNSNKSSKSSDSEIMFKDEAPFEDDLPF